MMKKFILYMSLPVLLIGLLFLFFQPAQSQQVGKSILKGNNTGWYAPPAGKPRNVILIVGEGMGLPQISAAMVKNKGNLNLSQFQYMGYVKPWTSDDIVLSYHSILNALATGAVLRNSTTGVDASGKPVKTLMDVARAHQMATGMVLTGPPTNDFPASFFINQYETETAPERRALELFNLKPDVVFAGGADYFDKRTDKVNLLRDFHTYGYDVVERAHKVGKISGPKIMALVTDGDMYGAKTRGEYLPNAVMNAATAMTFNSYGYLLLVGNEHIAKANKANDVDYVANEVLDLDKAIGALFQAHGNDKETLIIVVGTPPAGEMSLTGGNIPKGTVQGAWDGKTASGNLIPIFANGPGADQFAGMYNIQDVYSKISDLLDAR